MHLFIRFEPGVHGLSLNWVRLVLPLIFLTFSFWNTISQIFMTIKIFKTKVLQQFYATLTGNSHKSLLLLPIILVTALLTINFLGVLPYIFTPTRHLSITARLSIPLWTGHLVLSLVKTPKLNLSHFVPLGTPVLLLPVIVIIEILRTLIRPVTLRIRLGANITTGHTLLNLTARGAAPQKLIISLLCLSGLFLLIVLERAVALIQAYVFRFLSLLYSLNIVSPCIN